MDVALVKYRVSAVQVREKTQKFEGAKPRCCAYMVGLANTYHHSHYGIATEVGGWAVCHRERTGS